MRFLDKIIIFILIQSFQRSLETDVEDFPIVDTKVGRIRGIKATDGEYYMFMGIPYAKVDEENPFGVSKPCYYVK